MADSTQVSVPPMADSTQVPLCDTLAAPPRRPCVPDTVVVRDTVIVPDTLVFLLPADTVIIRDTVVAEIPDSVLRWLDEPRCYAFSRRWTDFPHVYFLIAERPPRAYFSEGDTVHVWEGYRIFCSSIETDTAGKTIIYHPVSHDTTEDN